MYPKNLQIALNTVYASGDNGTLGSFTSITSCPVSKSISEPQTSGVWKTGLFASLKAFDNLLVTGQTDVIFDTADTFAYNGFQWQANAKANIFTDFDVTAGLYQFIGNDSSENNFGLTVNLSLSF